MPGSDPRPEMTPGGQVSGSLRPPTRLSKLVERLGLLRRSNGRVWGEDVDAKDAMEIYKLFLKK